MTTDSRTLAWEGVVNARDLGGLGRVRPGALVRMEAPTDLTEAGWASAWSHGVRTVVDLRHADEGEPDLAPRPPGMTTVLVPIDPEEGTPFYKRWHAIDRLATPLYFPALLAERPQPVVEAARAVANAAPGGVAFHCASGKDRTGLLALVLLALAGATPEEIAADYLLTFVRMKPVYDALGIRDQLTAVSEILERHGSTIEKSLASTVEALDPTAFLLENGMSEAEHDALLRRLTGD
jgi:protein-tyrosine phosphatase